MVLIMKYSQLHTRTEKTGKQYDSINATLLIKGGFIDQTMAGVYAYLPLGLRVLTKIEQIVREEMNLIATEVLLPALSPTLVWSQTDRLNSIDVLMTAQGGNEASKKRNNTNYVLNSTHEELMTPIVQKFNLSYKDFPVALYQIQSKFRNEARAKSGLLRGREFRMKDLYSFHESEADLQAYYELVKTAYQCVFQRIGLGSDTVLALASGGDFTKDYSHEFQTKCESGEDTIFFDEVSETYYNKEVAPSQAPQVNEEVAQLAMQEILTQDLTTVASLIDFLKIPVEKCVKTMIYLTDDERVVAAAVRGDYDINEIKLRKVVSCNSLKLASADEILGITGAKQGYAGLLNLPPNVTLVVDDAVASLTNFECGANKTDYHLINVNWQRDLPKPDHFYDIKLAKPGDLNPKSGQPLAHFAASEVGNIFPLGTKFSKAFNYTYSDQSGQQQLVWMGSYGIGTSRLLGVIVEKFHDEKGIVWPSAVAPFTAHLISLPGGELNAEQLYQQLIEAGIEVLWDDRQVSAGQKFSDADLIGCPYRLVVSTKTQSQTELKARNNDQTELLSTSQIINRLLNQT